MADLQLTAMTTPNNQVTYCTLDGTPYRGDDSNIVQVRPQDIAYLQTLGFQIATAANVPPGDPLVDDTGWPVAT